ncbi:MAG: SOS response-associated peptidase [Planctomycetota bacterium]|nr:SOS response-associated peptidase [Planctomycetota bacterium]
MCTREGSRIWTRGCRGSSPVPATSTDRAPKIRQAGGEREGRRGMCGRFTRMYSWKRLHELLDLRYPGAEEMAPSWNVAPSQSSPVCIVGDGGRELAVMRWGFTPAWSRASMPGPINARSETVATNGMFRAAYRARRCLVPVSGFYEWSTKGPVKQPYYVRPREGEIFAMGGIWERWGEGEAAVTSFAILTTEANETMATLHDRMPVIVRASDYARWLGPVQPPADLLRPIASDEMCMHAVSTRVNSPRNNDTSLCAPVEVERGLW